MKRGVIKEIWKDAVWSKVISVVLIGISTLLYNMISTSFGDTTFLKEFKIFWNLKFELWKIIIVLAIFSLLLMNLKSKFKYDPETLLMDRNFFSHIRNDYSLTEFMLKVKSNCFSNNPFESEVLHPISHFLENSKKADFEFINPLLNKLKNELVTEIEYLDELIIEYIFGTGNQNWLAIPSEWKLDQPERFVEAKTELNNQENTLIEKYEEMIRIGRRVLKV